MAILPTGFVEVWYKGVVRVPTPERAIATIMLTDNNGRTIAIPLQDSETELVRRTLQGKDKEPQIHHLLLTCLEELGTELDCIRILDTPAFDLSTDLILRSKGGSDITVQASCSDAVVCAEIAGAPIYVEEKLMAAISTVASNYKTRK